MEVSVACKRDHLSTACQKNFQHLDWTHDNSIGHVCNSSWSRWLRRENCRFVSKIRYWIIQYIWIYSNLFILFKKVSIRIIQIFRYWIIQYSWIDTFLNYELIERFFRYFIRDFLVRSYFFFETSTDPLLSIGNVF